jgi:hypothetical protein
MGGVTRWFGDDDEDSIHGGLAGRIGGIAQDGLIPGQVGRKLFKGKGGLGYGEDAVMEVDPVRQVLAGGTS